MLVTMVISSAIMMDLSRRVLMVFGNSFNAVQVPPALNQQRHPLIAKLHKNILNQLMAAVNMTGNHARRIGNVPTTAAAMSTPPVINK